MYLLFIRKDNIHILKLLLATTSDGFLSSCTTLHFKDNFANTPLYAINRRIFEKEIDSHNLHGMNIECSLG